MWLRTAVVRPGGLRPGAAAGATQHPRCARPRRRRCERSSHGARRVGLPVGPAFALRHPSLRGRVLRAVRCCAHSFAGCGAPRAVAAARLASLAPRRVRLRLTPSPRSRRRANRPLHSPSLRAWRRRESAAVLPLQPPCPFPRRPPLASGIEWLAVARACQARALAGHGRFFRL